MKLPVLWSYTQADKIQIWKIRTENNTIIIEYYTLGSKHTVISNTITDRRNIGMINERTLKQCARDDAESAWNKKIERKGFRTIDDPLLLKHVERENDRKSAQHFYRVYGIRSANINKILATNDIYRDIIPEIDIAVVASYKTTSVRRRDDVSTYKVDEQPFWKDMNDLKHNPPQAMLSDDLSKPGINMPDFPLLAQMKLDGERRMVVVINDIVTMWSRERKQLQFCDSIKKDLFIAWPILMQYVNYIRGNNKFDDCVDISDTRIWIDGEIKDRDRKLSRQKIGSICRRTVNPKDDNDICIWIFDIGGTNLPLVDRMHVLRWFFTDKRILVLHHIREVVFHELASEDELIELHRNHIDGGDEGTMIKVPYGLYVPKRNAMTLKVKNEEDSEATIIGYKCAHGSQEGAVIWKVRDEEYNVVFDATPIYNIKKRCKMYRHGERYINTRVTVLYYGRSDDNVPQHARVKDHL